MGRVCVARQQMTREGDLGSQCPDATFGIHEKGLCPKVRRQYLETQQSFSTYSQSEQVPKKRIAVLALPLPTNSWRIRLKFELKKTSGKSADPRIRHCRSTTVVRRLIVG
jgi:hypothetical protein